MKRYRYWFVLLTALMFVLTGCSGQSADENNESKQNEAQRTENQNVSDALTRGQFGVQFLEVDSKQIFEQLSEDFQQMVSEVELKHLVEGFNEGVLQYSLAHQFSLGSLDEYHWIDQTESKGVRVTFDEHDVIVGLQLVPLTTGVSTDEQWTKTEFRVPTTETWFTFWGGTNELVNYHYALPAQRYAYDWTIVKDGKSYSGDPYDNESYYAFGKDVVAPASGTVIAVLNNVPDNTPMMEMNPDQPLGNYVIIDHGNDEYSVLAHFKEGSVVVSEGDEVEAGDLIGLAGNSGNSSEPHIHFHVMDGKDWMTAQSLRIRFAENVDPIRGDQTPAGF